MDKISVVLIDDHVLVRDGIKAMLEADREIDVVGEANNGRQAVDLIKTRLPDLAIMDIRMPEMNGLEACAILTQDRVSTKVVMLSMHDNEEYVLQSLSAGAWGYLLKDTDKGEFIRAIKQINNGVRYYSGSVSNILANQLLGSAKQPALSTGEKRDAYGLSKRERQILALVVDGKHNKDIAELLGKSVRTIETHRFNIMKKLAVNNAVDMINKAMKENIL
ncbi:DNA-binding response regulator [Parapedobacter pyrenivorans]|uniref:DNA-binding response regulator n=1 Tax=Parapedobacter pyrenivorans TaxID=1305674 RepID=A0A917HCJ8_9SPHI|nr:response regulator transcription factor [Parapedobacter pyrenivorans]GGG74934.1 DNA-binding response regulator [Parapedobacter pyrenivorans]